MVTTDKDKNADAILRQVIDRRISEGRLRESERERAVQLSHTLWHGQKGNGEAVDDAVRVIESGS